MKMKTLLGILIAWLSLSLGHPLYGMFWGVLASSIGVALFWSALSDVVGIQRFSLATLFFMSVSAFEYEWALSHPFGYIYFVWLLVSLLYGLQFGVLTVLVDRLDKGYGSGLVISSVWVLLEWSRLFWLSGFSWYPLGLSWTVTPYGAQFASVVGVYGLSFLVVFVNYCVYIAHLRVAFLVWSGVFCFGIWQYHLRVGTSLPQVSALLVQTDFHLEDELSIKNPHELLDRTYEKWKKIVSLVADHAHEKIDFLVLPEYVVHFGTYYPVFALDQVHAILHKAFGSVEEKLPRILPHLGRQEVVDGEKKWFVNNAYWSQALANIFDADVIVGLEDTDQIVENQSVSYTTASVFFPQEYRVERYAKRILVPMGEYVPFGFLASLARDYGVGGSYTPGDRAKVLDRPLCRYGLCVCYEETYGDLMRQNRMDGAELLVNLTNDFWYPDSNLPWQHLYHSRLRAIEMGMPLVRSANTGVTGVIDARGDVVSCIGQHGQKPDGHAQALCVDVPMTHFSTLYTLFGDSIVVGFSSIATILGVCYRRKLTKRS